MSHESDGALDQAIAAIRKQYGEVVIHFGDVEPDVARVQTGSIELDLATGGGIPVGRVSRMWGSPLSGKSLMCWQVIRGCQRKGMSCAYYNIEKQYDKGFVQSLGVDVGKLLLVEGADIESTGTKLEALLGSVDVHVLDSCSSAISVDELKAKVEDWQIGLRARAWAKVMSRALERMDNHRNMIILVDQARQTFGNYGGGEHPPNGKMMEHSSSLTLHFKRGAHLWKDKDGLLQSDFKKAAKAQGASDLTEADGFECQIKVDKSRVCHPFRAARIYYDFLTRRFDVAYEFTKVAVHYEIVKQNGAWYTLPSGQKVMGEGNLRREIIKDMSLRKTIYRESMKIENPPTSSYTMQVGL